MAGELSINTHMKQKGDEPSAIREIFAYGLARKAEIGAANVYDFSIGNPSVPAPEKVSQLLANYAQACPTTLHGYTAAAGLPEVRATLAQNLNRRFGTSYSAENLYMTCGAAASLAISLKAIINPGDEVCVLAPYFPEYRVWVESMGAKLVEIPLTDEFTLDFSAIECAINPHTKALIINTPNNPVGNVYSPCDLKRLAEVLRHQSEFVGHPIFLISDEPYRELVYDDIEIAWVPSLYDYTLVCYSWSKSLSLPGERIGYILVPPTFDGWQDVYAAVCGAGRVLGFVCAPALFQRIAAACVDEPADTTQYRQNRDDLCTIMDEAGLTYIKPQGAFYLWIKSPVPDAQEAARIAKRFELLLVPSDSFGVSGYLRAGYCVSADTIKNSREAFIKFAAACREA